MSKQLYFEQFNLGLVRSLNVKIVLFQVIQFSISRQFSFIWSIQARVDLEAMALKGYSSFPKAPALLEPHHLIV